MVNRLVQELGPMSALAPAFPQLPRSAPLRLAAERAGNHDFSPLWAGQNVSGCKEISAAAPAAGSWRAKAGFGFKIEGSRHWGVADLQP